MYQLYGSRRPLVRGITKLEVPGQCQFAAGGALRFLGVRCWATLLVGCVVGMFTASASGDEGAASDKRFEQEIRPVLISKCIQCHGAKKQEGGLRLDSAEAIAEGGESGETLVAGSPEESLIIEAIKYEGNEMPPTEQLSERTIAQFEQWIAEGATWPQQTSHLREESGVVADEDRQWWAFRPVVKVDPPEVNSRQWPINEIDHFVLKRLEDQKMTPAPVASPQVLIRRLYFDLLGLPPTPAEITAFLDDRDEDAWERVVDRLLEDPRYGEHWARHWLDLVRYSESDGWNLDAYRPAIWRYRDYVVEAFNCDKPYPDFVREQLAGDEIDFDNPTNRIAAGFLRLGIYEYNQRDARGHWNDIMNEMTDVAGDVFLGLSMACARCHDHKFDPLPQRDYFKLRAFFEPVIWRDDLHAATTAEQQAYQVQLAHWEEATAEVRQQIDALVQPYHDAKWISTVDKFPLDIQACYHKPADQRSSWDEQMTYLISRQFLEEGGGPLKSMTKEDKEKLDTLEKQLAAWDEIKPDALPAVMTVTEHRGPLTATCLPNDPDQVAVAPGFLEVLSRVPLPDFQTAENNGRQSRRPSETSTLISTQPRAVGKPVGRRTQLANWIGNPQNPLTTRVIVNRIWQQHFGQGLVATSNDFGRLGAEPSHPALLDWLTATFVEQGWSFKKLHKTILMSATWRQSAHHPLARQFELKDPKERLLWRARVRRLQAEQIRDAMLMASGELANTIGGASVDEQEPRRALYVKCFRNNLDTFLHSFDMAGGLKSVAVRDATTTPTQALLLINGSYALERAKKMSEFLSSGQPLTPSDRLQRAFMLVWGRNASDDELARALAFVAAPTDEIEGDIAPERLVDFCHILFNSNEFLYVD